MTSNLLRNTSSSLQRMRKVKEKERKARAAKKVKEKAKEKTTVKELTRNQNHRKQFAMWMSLQAKERKRKADLSQDDPMSRLR